MQNPGYENQPLLRDHNAPQAVYGGYPPQNNGYPPQNNGYPPQNNGYPPQNNGYPPQNNGYPPQGGYAPAGPATGPSPPPPGNWRTEQYSGDLGTMDTSTLPSFPAASAPPPATAPSHLHITPHAALENSVKEVTPDMAIAAYDAFLNNKFFASHNVGSTMVVEHFNPSVAFHVSVGTFVETRSFQHAHRPYSGTAVDGPEYGPPPGMWAIVPSAPAPFVNSSQVIKVPHTETVRTCFRCRGRGDVTCTSCSGWGHHHCHHCNRTGRVDRKNEQGEVIGKEDCHYCHGHGRTQCRVCHSRGYVTCGECSGLRNLVHSINLHIIWALHTASQVHEASRAGEKDLPHNIVMNSKKVSLWQEEGYTVAKREDRMNAVVAALANRCIDQSAPLVPNQSDRMLLGQRLSVEGCPMYEVVYKKRGKNWQFWMYGVDNRVFAHEYPKNRLKVGLCYMLLAFLTLLVLAGIGYGIYYAVTN